MHILAGRRWRPGKWARQRCSAERSRWFATKAWHPNQRGSFDAQSRWNLDLPHADPRELVMDILRHVPQVQVQWPQELADEVRGKLPAGLRRLDE